MDERCRMQGSRSGDESVNAGQATDGGSLQGDGAQHQRFINRNDAVEQGPIEFAQRFKLAVAVQGF